ncbi:hypothetical protein BGZ47_011261 [Haplosporangium gracile]|nr:hypothetical protein BGZ47_011261 [Haplosporangium gracile]
MSSTQCVAIVTESSRGIDRAIALCLAQDGFNVVINYQSNPTKALGEGQKLLDATIATFGRLDVVVFNAAWLHYKSIHDMTEAFDTNVKRLMFFSKVAQPYLAKAQASPVFTSNGNTSNNKTVGKSRIINIGATLTIIPLVQGDHFLYCAIKGTLEQVTHTLTRTNSLED